MNTQWTRRAVWWSVILLALPVSLIALGELVVGLTFGFNLWRADRPFAIALWFAVVLFPGYLAWVIASWERPRRFYMLAIGAWLFVVFWVYQNFIWMPWTFDGPWGW